MGYRAFGTALIFSMLLAGHAPAAETASPDVAAVLPQALPAPDPAAAGIPVPPPHPGADKPRASPVPAEVREHYQQLANPVEPTAEALAKGRLLYAANCQVCHGEDGRGVAPGKPSSFAPEPRVLGAMAFQMARTDGELFYVIGHGVAGTAMLSWEGRLSEREMWLLVTYIRSLPH